MEELVNVLRDIDENLFATWVAVTTICFCQVSRAVWELMKR